jgi:hypothetical protein
MDFEDLTETEFEVLMQKVHNLKMKKDKGEEHKPLKENLSFFSGNLRGKVLKMTSSDLNTAVLPTIVIGTISAAYDENMWDKDMLEVGAHFNLTVSDDVNNVFLIKMEPLSDNPSVMDSSKAIKLMERAVFRINTGNSIRIVRVGISSTRFFYEAVSYGLNQWTSTEKKVQFVTAGDTKRNKMFEFCKSLCLSGACTEIEYYDTQDYHPFGFFKSEWHRPY